MNINNYIVGAYNYLSKLDKILYLNIDLMYILIWKVLEKSNFKGGMYMASIFNLFDKSENMLKELYMIWWKEEEDINSKFIKFEEFYCDLKYTLGCDNGKHEIREILEDVLKIFDFAINYKDAIIYEKNYIGDNPPNSDYEFKLKNMINHAIYRIEKFE